MDKIWIFVILWFLAMLTVHFISWIGSVLHSVPNSGNSSYAVFTFRADQNKSMSTNVLINIIIPNVILVFIHMFLFYNVDTYEKKHLIFYVMFYYAYRSILIVFILKRRELYCLRYESFNAVAGVLVALLLTKYFLGNPKDIFIPVSELVNEFWLVIIIVIYNFLLILCDKVFTQNKIVNEQMIDNYIRNKFDYFYCRYKDIIDVKAENKIIWILLFSIMIFENYNRGSIIRKMERLKVRLGKCATVGIMQVKSEKNISDEESIALAYRKLKDEIVGENIDIDDEMQICYYAFQYNPDDDYAKSISYIYQRLYIYLELIPRYCNEFHLQEKIEEDVLEQETINEIEESYEEESGEDNLKEDSYLTIKDIMKNTGLTKKQVKKKLKKKHICVWVNEEDVNRVFEKNLPRG